MIPYEILIRGKKDGTYSGAHVVRTPGAKAEPVSHEMWPALCADLNAGLIESNDALTAQVDKLTAEYAALKALTDGAVRKASAAIADALNVATETTAADALKTIGDVVKEVTTPDAQKKAEALRLEIAQKQAELAQALAAIGEQP